MNGVQNLSLFNELNSNFTSANIDNLVVKTNVNMIGASMDGLDSDQVTEGVTNLYYTQSRVDTELAASTVIVHTTGNETIAGTKTFSSTISGSINGNSATVTTLPELFLDGDISNSLEGDLNNLYLITSRLMAQNLAGFSSSTGTITYADTIISAFGKLYGNDALKALDSAVVHNTGNETIAGTKTFSSTISGNINGNAATVTTIPVLSGDVSNAGNVILLSPYAILGVHLAGYVSGAGTVSLSDTILTAIQKIDGNDQLKALDSAVVHNTGNETIAGVKTFSSAPVFSSITNTNTLTLPTTTDTLVGRATTDTLTNKTLTLPVISSISNTGTVTIPTGTDTLVNLTGTQTLTNKTLTLPIISSISNGGTVTIPSGVDTLVNLAGTQTLTNKTLTLPIISSISNGGTVTIPSGANTLVARATTDTLTNKTLTLPIISSISNSGTVTIPTGTDTLVNLTGTQTLTNKTLTTPIITSISNTGTVTIPTGTDTLVNLTGSQTLTNKTLTTPIITSISNTGTVTIPTGTDTLVNLTASQTLTNKTLTLPVISSISNGGTVTIPSGADTIMTLGSTQTITGAKTINNTLIARQINPTTTATYDIGTTSLTYRNIYLSAEANIAGDVTIGGNKVATGATNGLQLTGTASAIGGGHFQAFTTTDNYPLLQNLNWVHDNVSLNFDSYFDGTTWRSSYSGSNFQIQKFSSQLQFNYASGITAGSAVTWTTGFFLGTGGRLSTQEVRPITDNTYTNGDASFRWTAVYAVNGSIQTSDKAQKTNITPSTLGLDFINQLAPVSYQWKNPSSKFKGTSYGLLAQDVQSTLNTLGVNSFNGYVEDVNDDGTKSYGLIYTELICPLVKAIQELTALVVALETKISANNK